MNYSKTYIAFIIFFIASTFLLSQENVLKPKSQAKEVINEENFTSYQISIGVELGLNYNMHSMNLAWESEVPQSIYNVFESGSGISPYFAALVDFPINDKYGFQFKVAYDSRSYSNTYTGIADAVEINSSTVFDAPDKVENKITGADISISALFRYIIANDFVLTVGPMVSLPAGDYTQELTQTSLMDGVGWFDEFGTLHSQIVLNTPITDVKTRFGIDLGLGYRISLTSSIVLVPQIRLNYMLTNIEDDGSGVDNTRAMDYGNVILDVTNSKLHCLKFGVGFWF